MSGFDQLPQSAAELFGPGATAEESYGLLTVDVPPDAWIAALTTARSTLGCTFFDWLSAVDEPGTGFRVSAHVVALGGHGAVAPAADAASGPGPSTGPTTVRTLLIRTTVPHDAAELPTATGVYAGAAWHERETHEMFGVAFPGHPHLAPLLLPDEFEGHPLRKDFVLAARVAKAWPGAKEPGESHDGGPKRRQMQPPGVPDPNDWGPLKGQLPPAAARPARTPRTAPGGAAGAPPGERPARRTRSVSEGSTSQRPAPPAAPGGEPPAADGPAAPAAPPRKRTPDTPWEQPRPAPAAEPPAEPSAEGAPKPAEGAGPESTPRPEPAPEPASEQEPRTEPDPRPAPESAPESAPEPEPRTEGGPRPEPEPPAEGGDDA